MAPLCLAGDTLHVEPLSRPPRVGEILVFPGERGLVAHRVVGIRGGAQWRAVLQGDAREEPDGELGPREILGRVTVQERGGRILDHRWLVIRAIDRLAAVCPGRSLPARAARRALAALARVTATAGPFWIDRVRRQPAVQRRGRPATQSRSTADSLPVSST